MSDLSNFWWQSAAGGGGVGYQIGNSLRFRGAQYLQRTFGNDGSGRAWTYSGWIKKAGPNTRSQPVIAVGDSFGSQNSFFGVASVWDIQNSTSGGGIGGYISWKGDRRDFSAWYHWVLQKRSGTANDWRLYVNGVELTVNSNNVTWNNFNRNIIHYIGRDHYDPAFLDGYLAELHFVDGQILDPTDFGQFNADGVWVPIDVTGLTYGTNGFYLDFSDPNDIGADRSGRGNNFTPTGFELTDTTSANYDSMADSPTDNFSTLNPIGTTTGFTTPTNGNLETNSGIEEASTEGTLAIPKDGNLYYFEGELIYDIGDGGVSCWLGAKQQGYTGTLYSGPKIFGFIGTDGGSYDGAILFFKYDGSNEPALGGHVNSGTVFGFAIKYDSGTWKYYVRQGSNGWHYYNGSSWVYNTSFDETEPTTTSTVIPEDDVLVPFADNIKANFGQRAFAFTPPASAKPLSTAELPAVAITKPSDHFTTILDSGANILTAAQAKFPNGLWWIKDRANSNDHQLVDSVSGTAAVRTCPGNADAAYATPAGNSVAWCWATPASGINTAAGFSITNGTHGLGVTPAFVIDRQLNVWHQSLTAGQGLKLSTNAGPAAQTWTVNATTVTGPGGGPYWTWAEVPGYSSFGSYFGNGATSANSGPFVYLGFRPAFAIIKRTDGVSGFWAMWDSERSPYNIVDRYFSVDTTNNETQGSGSGWWNLDFVSNGFRVQSFNESNTNAAGGQYVYIAFAEHCFGGSNVSPAPAR